MLNLLLVGYLRSNAFLATLRRFVFRREKPIHIHANNGATFVSAKRELNYNIQAKRKDYIFHFKRVLRVAQHNKVLKKLPLLFFILRLSLISAQPPRFQRILVISIYIPSRIFLDSKETN